MDFLSTAHTIHFIVMSSVFDTEKPIHVKYDLKGSTVGRVSGGYTYTYIYIRVYEMCTKRNILLYCKLLYCICICDRMSYTPHIPSPCLGHPGEGVSRWSRAKGKKGQNYDDADMIFT